MVGEAERIRELEEQVAAMREAISRYLRQATHVNCGGEEWLCVTNRMLQNARSPHRHAELAYTEEVR